MKWIKQYNKPNCGQIAVAVISNKSVREIYKLIGHDGYTGTKDLTKALRKLGFKCPNKLRRLNKRPKLAVAKLSHPLAHSWHWVVISNNKIFDGNYGNKSGKVNWKKGWKITSYLPIKK